MNRTMPRKLPLKLTADQSAAEFVARINYCEFCHRTNVALCCHEVAKGGGCRLEARQADFARLCLCGGYEDSCHDVLHRMASQDAVAAGLALIYHSRAADFNLEAFWKLTARRWPDFQTVDRWTRRLIRPRQR